MRLLLLFIASCALVKADIKSLISERIRRRSGQELALDSSASSDETRKCCGSVIKCCEKWCGCHQHYPHSHNPHSHDPHSHDPHSHDPHRHHPHSHVKEWIKTVYAKPQVSKYSDMQISEFNLDGSMPSFGAYQIWYGSSIVQGIDDSCCESSTKDCSSCRGLTLGELTLRNPHGNTDVNTRFYFELVDEKNVPYSVRKDNRINFAAGNIYRIKMEWVRMDGVKMGGPKCLGGHSFSNAMGVSKGADVEAYSCTYFWKHLWRVDHVKGEEFTICIADLPGSQRHGNVVDGKGSLCMSTKENYHYKTNAFEGTTLIFDGVRGAGSRGARTFKIKTCPDLGTRNNKADFMLTYNWNILAAADSKDDLDPLDYPSHFGTDPNGPRYTEGGCECRSGVNWSYKGEFRSSGFTRTHTCANGATGGCCNFGEYNPSFASRNREWCPPKDKNCQFSVCPDHIRFDHCDDWWGKCAAKGTKAPTTANRGGLPFNKFPSMFGKTNTPSERNALADKANAMLQAALACGTQQRACHNDGGAWSPCGEKSYCKTSSSSATSAVKSGDSIYLLAWTGKNLGVGSNNVVNARETAKGSEQLFKIFKPKNYDVEGAYIGTPIQSGDAVCLRSVQTGKTVDYDSGNDKVLTRWNHCGGSWQRLIIETSGGGPVKQGDKVTFSFPHFSNRNIHVDTNNNVAATWNHDFGDWQTFTIQV